MAELIIDIQDKSLIPMLKKLIDSLPGVSLVKPIKKVRKSGIEEAYEDVASGRVKKATDVDDMFAKILGI